MWCKRVQDKNRHQRGHMVRIQNSMKTTLSDHSVELYLCWNLISDCSGLWFSSSHTHRTTPSPGENRYLTSFQRLPVVWIVCDQLLSSHPPNLPPTDATSLQQHQFFAAQTLHSKCQVSERCASATSCFVGKLEGFAERPLCKSCVRFCVGCDGESSFQFETVGDAIGHVSVDRGCSVVGMY